VNQAKVETIPGAPSNTTPGGATATPTETEATATPLAGSVASQGSEHSPADLDWLLASIFGEHVGISGLRLL
jgi:hypothetical protein